MPRAATPTQSMDSIPVDTPGDDIVLDEAMMERPERIRKIYNIK
ncbi:hypothetical protein THARTR1_06744 [Trichoderma harzianum]|uniref:Uncharacterized protein n=1 Tax=Trichoderma harzianum TaxID=5544 RepID=A0A2K0U554_TRIHA|nr:hypothetical protein THARTR1_06744 [Trichoderma harzianum]